MPVIWPCDRAKCLVLQETHFSRLRSRSGLCIGSTRGLTAWAAGLTPEIRETPVLGGHGPRHIQKVQPEMRLCNKHACKMALLPAAVYAETKISKQKSENTLACS